MLLGVNAEAAARKMQLNITAWDFNRAHNPQADAFLKWSKVLRTCGREEGRMAAGITPILEDTCQRTNLRHSKVQLPIAFAIRSTGMLIKEINLGIHFRHA